MADNTEQKTLKEFIKRRHPLYEEMLPHWNFLEATYDGGREWFSANIFRYIKEGDLEYKDRVARGYRFNHTAEVVDIVDKYVFKLEIKRDENKAPDSVKAFWKSSTKSGAPIKEYMKRVSNRSSVFGRPWIFVDSTKDAETLTKADEKKTKARVYSYIVPPQHVLDMGYDELGEPHWVLVYEISRDDKDPMKSSGALIERYRLWTRTDSTLFKVRKEGNKVVIDKEAPVIHDLGVVPAIKGDNVMTDDLWTSKSMISDVAYLDRAIANYLSNLDAIIQDQTFSQLVMPAEGIVPGSTEHDNLVAMGTKRIFTYNGEAGKPEYISPDVKQSELILKVINKIINEIYHSVGLAGERTKEDNALGIDNSSGVAKAYDFERVNALLSSKADSLQNIENRLCKLVALWSGDKNCPDDLVLYPDNFDVRGLYDEFDIAARLALIEAPESVRSTQMDSLVAKLFPQLSDELKNKIKAELKSWPPKPVLGDPNSAGPDVISAIGKKQVASKVLK